MSEFSYVSTLGEGAFGRVLLVRHEGNLKALKVIRINWPTTDTDRISNRFRREMRVMADLHHPGIMPIEPTTTLTGGPAYFMPVAESSLADLISQNPHGMDEEEALSIILQVLDALIYIHGKQIVHRDINPRNILFLGERVVISDFGLTRDLSSSSQTMTVAMAGTRGYMSPEQLNEAHRASQVMDIYAVGVVMHELLCGERPESQAVNTAVQGQLRTILHKATSYRPTARYASAGDFASAILTYQSSTADLADLEDSFTNLLRDAENDDEQARSGLRELAAANLDDPEMYWQSLPKVPPFIFRHWNDEAPGFLEDVAHHLIEHLQEFDTEGDWSRVDKPVRLIKNLWHAINDDAVKVGLLRPLAELATKFNRYFAAETFASLTGQVASNPTFLPEVVTLIREDYEFRQLLQPYFEGKRSPTAVRRALGS